MNQSTLSARRLAGLVAGFDRAPAYVGLADALTLLIGDGRVGLDVRLPSERDLTEALGISRTTVTRAYSLLREAGYAEARVGAGTFTRVPGGRSAVHDRALLPRAGDHDAIDLNCAAASAPPGIAAAYADAVAELPAYLSGHGYYPAGLRPLQEAIAATYAARGLPTDPEQILVTPGALSATTIVARAFLGAGDRALVESPVYPNAMQAIAGAGARLRPLPVDPQGWDLDVVRSTVRDVAPRLAYLIPDFQNPTGHLMDDEQRAATAAALRRARTVPLIDEAHQPLALDGQRMPMPFAAHAPAAITVGSASKAFWGGMRVGWIRSPHEHLDRITQARLGLDLGVPVIEQLAAARLLADPAAVLGAHLARLRAQRDALVDAVATHLPQWRFVRPSGGLVLWCELPRTPRTSAVRLAAEAERRDVIVAPGPAFALNGGLDRFVRIPWTRPEADLVLAVERLAEAWEGLTAAGSRDVVADRRPGRAFVA
ncbi:PLP-dependent aminotransferase family protein [Nocardioides sp. R-C-SC26]|uniref:MocR-like transcription factor YczR n=1 Tax=Nocardioides sp. R-C-SC26 TaxID=2870414 RepID=UPI001E349603|nr:PLP-dependent aminotransferase family protein [Nocardioides sp. R-C-SC26]